MFIDSDEVQVALIQNKQFIFLLQHHIYLSFLIDDDFAALLALQPHSKL